MITKFETANAGGTTDSGSGKGGNTLMIVAGVGIALACFYFLYWKPKKDREKAMQQQNR
jgi:preprotein translocase subunit YajC